MLGHRTLRHLTLRRRLLRPGVALASLLIAVSIPAGAHARPSPAQQLEIPREWRAAEPSAYERLLAARSSRLTPEAFADLERALLREASGPGAVVADPEFVYPHRAGDLDGDGLGDVITVAFWGEEAVMHARRGSDASVLWGIEGAHVAVPTSRGVLTLRTETAPALPRPAIPGSPELPGAGATARAQVVELRGNDGSLVWAHAVPMAGARFGDMYRGGGGDLDWVGSVREIDDATGDGVRDAWIVSSTFTQLNTGEMMITADRVTGRTLDGVTGVEVGRVTAEATDALPWVIPVPDLSGDGLADVITFTANDDDTGTLEARTVDGDLHWTRQIGARFAYVMSHELTGDGAPDVMLQAFVDGGVTRFAHDGADGAPLWQMPDAGYTDVAGDIDGDGGNDLIRMETLDTSNVATALAGTTGEVLWGPVAYAGPPDAWVLFCTCTGDLTADGIWDPMMAEVVFGETVTVTVRMLDGTDGAALWTGVLPPSSTFPGLLGADVDGDGAEDLGMVAADGATMAVHAWRGIDGTPLWSASAPWDGFPIYAYGDDVAGDATPELLVSAVRFVEESFSGSAHAYDTGGRIWTVP